MSLASLGQAIIKKIAFNKIKLLYKIEDLNKKFSIGCPSNSELLKIVNQRNEIVKVLTQLKRQISLIDKTINPLKTLLPILNTTITSLKLAPAPIPPGLPRSEEHTSELQSH